VTRTEIEKFRDLLRSLKVVALAVRDGREPIEALKKVTDGIDELLVISDPDERAVTPLGARILEAAAVVGLDEFRLEKSLHETIKAGSLTRLLHHDVKKVRVDVLAKVADLIGCELEWLQFARGEQRTKPAPLGVHAARSFGASEEAIRAVREKHADASWTEEEWVVAFLAMSKQLKEEEEKAEAGAEGSPREARGGAGAAAGAGVLGVDDGKENEKASPAND
jgi:hypothetical protein